MFFGSLLCSAVRQNTIRSLRFVENSRHAAKYEKQACCYGYFVLDYYRAGLCTAGLLYVFR